MSSSFTAMPPDSFVCPISCDIMQDPVVTADGLSYERAAIEHWFSTGHTTSPRTNAPLPHQHLVPNVQLRQAIEAWKDASMSAVLGAAVPCGAAVDTEPSAASAAAAPSSTLVRADANVRAAASDRSALTTSAVARPTSTPPRAAPNVAAGDDDAGLASLWASGFNRNGELGLGDSTNRVSFAQLHVSNGTSDAALGAISVAGGAFHTLFANRDGAAYSSGINAHGQLGAGDISCPLSLVPRRVVRLNNVTMVAAGQCHSVFLRHDGTVWTCGFNGFGQLGVGDRTDRWLPVQAQNLDSVAAVCAHSNHTVCLKADGAVWGCGCNRTWQLGGQPRTARWAGDADTLGGSGGGNAGGNAVGVPSSVDSLTPEQRVLEAQNDCLVPVPVRGLRGVIAVATGGHHSVFLRRGGAVLACGLNKKGELGVGDTTARETPAPVQLAFLRGFNDVINIGAGNAHTVLLRRDGTAWTCGDNMDGQLGLGKGDARHRASPTLVPGVRQVRSVVAGFNNTLFVRRDGVLFACGANHDGRLGFGDTSPRTQLEQVPGVSDVAAVAVGGTHVLLVQAENGLSRLAMDTLEIATSQSETESEATPRPQLQRGLQPEIATSQSDTESEATPQLPLQRGLRPEVEVEAESDPLSDPEAEPKAGDEAEAEPEPEA